MKNSILLLTTFLTLGTVGWLTNPKSPSANGQILNSETNRTRLNDPFQEKLDSIEKFRLKELNKYESEIKNSFKTVKKEQEKLKKIDMSVDSLFNILNTPDTLTQEITQDTIKNKKKSWFKRQIDKLKNK